MKIGFIGAGKVAKGFGIYLKESGLELSGFYSRTLESAQEAAKLTNSKSLALEEVAKNSTVVFITTPDDLIEKVCNEVAEQVGFSQGQTIAHMSGSLSSEQLKMAKQQGCNTFSLHPLQSFADPVASAEKLKDTFFAWEGKGNKKDISNILTVLGNNNTEISPEDKSLYHSAACIASNYLVTLLDSAIKLLEDTGIDRELSCEIISNLATGTVSNISNLDTTQALTGPIVRGDVSTISSHLDAYEKKGLLEIKNIYALMGLKTLDIAAKRGLSPEKIDHIKKILKEENFNE
ncbi:DUF2520 domain-containing protein [Proteinivorax hydrogeniformans]|uniref:DUF2520 domain-containing protein n=1 Tax=Proteinivorax hydrogeniformans TaxID=1826727 RepID=A0AAU8HW26_9FIRM